MSEARPPSIPTFRLAGPSDVEAVLGLLDELQQEDGLRLDVPAARPALERLLADPTLGRAWLIELEGGLAGYVVLCLGWSLEFRGRDAFVDELYVRGPLRSRGIGRTALEFVAEQARAIGVRALHLEVERKNTRAQALYRTMGYIDHDRYLMTRWLAGGDGPTPPPSLRSFREP